MKRNWANAGVLPVSFATRLYSPFTFWIRFALFSLKGMFNLRLMLATAAAVCVFAAKVPPQVSQGKLVDFTEQRHGGAGIAEYQLGMGSCVDRDYTMDLGSRIVVLRQSTCNPRLNPAMRCEVGQNAFVVIEKHSDGDRYGIIAMKGVMSETGDGGKPVWLKLFKVMRKDQAK